MKLPPRFIKGMVALGFCTLLIVGFALWENPADEIGTQVINRGLTDEKIVALTFDDGPHPVTTALLLDILKRHGIKATFFTVGQKAEEYPELLRREAMSDHQVACHTYSHDNLVCLSKHEMENEVTYWEENIDRIVGHGSRYLRPPGGDFNADTISMLRRRGYVLALWSVNPGDWRSPPPKSIVSYVMNRVHPGAVILMHDDGMNTIRALPTIIKHLKKLGYRFVTLEQMQQLNRVTSPQIPSQSATPSHPATKLRQPASLD